MRPRAFPRPSHTARRAWALLASSWVFLLLSTSCSPRHPLEEAFLSPEEQRGVHATTIATIEEATQALRERPEDIDALVALAHGQLQAVRENADAGIYRRVEVLATALEGIDPGNPEPTFLRGLIAAGRHDFAASLALAQQLTSSHPTVQRYQGLRVDALIELGRYEEAAAALQAMADVRPDATVLTRTAYLRELHGDRDGALLAMEDVLRDPPPSPEHTAWSLVEFARLLAPREPGRAREALENALAIFPGFAPAEARLADLDAREQRFAEALVHAQRAFDLLPTPEHAALLGDLLLVSGDPVRAETLYAAAEIAFDQLEESGTSVALERAAFLLDRDRSGDGILTLLEQAREQRPTIAADSLLAWALLRQGNLQEASEAAERSLRSGSQDAVLRYRAGVIAARASRTEEARSLLRQSIATDPAPTVLLAGRTLEALESLPE